MVLTKAINRIYTSMKRKLESEDDAGEGKRASTPVFSGDESGSLAKFSQNMDLSDTFDFSVIGGKVFNEQNERVLYIPLSKNSKIGRQLDQILRFIEERKEGESEGDDGNKEIILIATGNSIQKMVTIVEILKQKILQLQDYDMTEQGPARSGFRNTSIAKLPEYNQVVISGQVVSQDKIRRNYTQLNFIDYTLMERRVSVRKRTGKKNDFGKDEDGLYDRETLNQVLRIDKLVKVPVMYTYMNFHRHEQLSVRYVSKFKNLVSNGWSMQQS